MLENYERLLAYGIGKHTEKINPLRIHMALIYFGSILASTSNLHVVDPITGKIMKSNFFAMLFLSSSGGKDFLKSIYEKKFGHIFDKMNKAMIYLAFKPVEGEMILDSSLQKKIPKHYSISITSSDIGLYYTALAADQAIFGSINVEINEFGDHIDKAENINMLKELYDGEVKAKIIKGDKEDSARLNVSDAYCNMFAYGTPRVIKEDSSKMKTFKQLTSSGMFRRSLILYEEPTQIERVEPFDINIDDLVEHFEKMPLNTSIGTNGKGELYVRNHQYIIPMTPDAKIMIHDFYDNQIYIYNKNLLDELKTVDKNADKLITKMSSIIAYLNCDNEINVNHVQYAIDIFHATRETISDLFEETLPSESIFKTLQINNTPMLSKDLMKVSSIKSVKEFEQNIPILEEIAYEHNMILKVRGKRIKKYWLEPLPETNLNKIICSLSWESGRGEKAFDFTPREMPFFGEGKTIEQLVRSSDIDSFTTAHFEPSAQAPHGHRAYKNFISGQNLIAFDIDNGMSLDEAFDLLSVYTYIIYTTKSHRSEKSEGADRFRILIPTKNVFYVDVEQHKALYENIAEVIGVTNYDIQTRNVSRLWYTNPNAEIFTNQGELFNVECCIPDTVVEDKAMGQIQLINDYVEHEMHDGRISGIYKWAASRLTLGNRNETLFRVAMMLLEHNIEPTEHIEQINNMSSEPLPHSEVQTILSSARNRR